MIKSMLIAGAGGFIGTCGRYLVGKWCESVFHGSFPLGTFVVNVVGCFIIGLLFGLLERTEVLSTNACLLLVTGFCGGFTTFSTFANDMWILHSRGEWGTFVGYLVLSIVVGVALVWIGRSLIR